MDIGTSYGLAFSSGINAYLPLLSLALASHMWPDQFKVNPQFAFIAQPWCMIILAILAAADLFADKIPGVDHVWDLIHTFIRPVAGALVAASANSNLSGAWLPITLLLGGGLAGITHVTKATTRVASTATTAGCLNAVLSIVEDIIVVASIILSLVVPYVMLIVVILFVITFSLLVPRIIRIFRRRRQRAQVPPAPAMRGNYPNYPGRF
jgi:Domain of unknown function (DUF4126)